MALLVLMKVNPAFVGDVKVKVSGAVMSPPPVE